jgi:hypothetical protein
MMGNSGGCLSKYWAEFRNPSFPRLQGGFIWDMIDQALYFDPMTGIAGGKDPSKSADQLALGYGGDFGERPHTGAFCVNGLFSAERVPHPSAFEARHYQAPVSVFLHMASPVELAKTGAEKEITDASTTDGSQNSSVSKPEQKGKTSMRQATSDRAKQREARKPKTSQTENSTKENEPVILCLVMLNLRTHTDMNDLQVCVSLQVDICRGEPARRAAPVLLMRDNVPAGQASAIDLLQLWPSAAPFTNISSKSKSGTGNQKENARRATLRDLTVFANSMGLTVKELQQAREIWLHCKVITAVQSRFVPKNHVVYESTLRHEYLDECLQSFIAEAKHNIPASVETSSDALTQTKIFSKVEAISHEVITVSSIISMPTHDLHNSLKGDQPAYNLATQRYHGNSELLEIRWSSGHLVWIGVTCGRILHWSLCSPSTKAHTSITTTADGRTSSLPRVAPEKSRRVLIDSPVDVCISRSPTNNDDGGVLGLSYTDQWKSAGLQSLKRSNNFQKLSAWDRFRQSNDMISKEPDAIDSCHVLSKAENADKTVVHETDDVVHETYNESSQMVSAASHLVFTASWKMEPSLSIDKAVNKTGCDIQDEVRNPICLTVEAVYEFFPSGCIEVTHQVTVPRSAPPLPRAGIRFSCPGDLSGCQYLGLGPYEAYPDRKGCVWLDRFESSVHDLHTPYVVPQECGSRADPR